MSTSVHHTVGLLHTSVLTEALKTKDATCLGYSAEPAQEYKSTFTPPTGLHSGCLFFLSAYLTQRCQSQKFVASQLKHVCVCVFLCLPKSDKQEDVNLLL